jgi:hypothetical protein
LLAKLLLMIRDDCRTISACFSLANYLSIGKWSFHARSA